MEAPEFYGATGFCSAQFTSNEKHHSLDSNNKSIGVGDHFIVEDLLDFSNEDDDAMVADPNIINNTIVAAAANSTDSSTVTVVDSCNSSSFSGREPSSFNGDNGSHYTNNFSHHDVHFGSELCVPYDDLAELEWLSNFVEESFSSEDLQRLQLISGMKARPEESSKSRHFQTHGNTDDNNNGDVSNISNINGTMFNPETAVPAKARSKRSRAAPGNWASRLLVLSPTTSSSEIEIIAGPTPYPSSGKKAIKGEAGPKKRDGGGEGCDGRRCLHCATDKTPQWRTGPMGPKTLCNACGVRYKSGRLVPEYRPAASPTFVLTKHSNSHRKVLELRRQKEMTRAQQQHQHQHQHQQFLHHHQNMVFDVSNGGDDYLIHQHVGPDFRQMIQQ